MTEVAAPPPQSDAGERRGSPAWWSPLALAVVYLAFWQVAPRLRFSSGSAVLLSTIVSLALLVWFPALVARAVRSPIALLLHLVSSALLVVPLRVLGALGQPLPLPWHALLELDHRWLPGLSGLLFIWFASSLGGILSRIVRAPNLVPPVAVVLALVDIWTVMLHGPVQLVLQSENPAAVRTREAMTVRLPAPSPADAGATPMHVDVGFADFLFIAFFAAVVTRFWPERRVFARTVWAMMAALCAYMVLVMWRDVALPALVPLAVVMLALHWRRFRYTRSEAFAMLYAGVALVAVGVVLWRMGAAVLQPGPELPPTPNGGVTLEP